MVELDVEKEKFISRYTDFSLREQVNYPNGGVSIFYDNGRDAVIIDYEICNHKDGEPVFSYMLITDKQNSYVFNKDINGDIEKLVDQMSEAGFNDYEEELSCYAKNRISDNGLPKIILGIPDNNDVLKFCKKHNGMKLEDTLKNVDKSDANDIYDFISDFCVDDLYVKDEYNKYAFGVDHILSFDYDDDWFDDFSGDDL